jgi:SAM-dependent methyltransferase
MRVAYWGKARDIGDQSVEHALWKCRYCGHIYVKAFPSTLELSKAYETQDKRFFPDSEYFEKRKKTPLTDGELWVISHVLDRSGEPGMFLDIGSAQTKLLKQFRNNGWKVTAVEPGHHATLIEREVGCEVIQSLFEHAKFDQQFDIISALDVLEHSSNPISFLSQIEKVLSSEGIALFRFPNATSLRRFLHGENWEMILPLGHLHYFSPRSFDTACWHAGLQVNYWTTRDVFKYRYLKLSFRGAGLITKTKEFWDHVGLGDQMLASVSRAKDARRRKVTMNIYRKLRRWKQSSDN